MAADARGWLELRQALWPEAREMHLAEMALMASEETCSRLAAQDAGGRSADRIAHDFNNLLTTVNGAQASPVGFLEGLYVVPHARRQGVARALVAEVARWTVSCGCTELASDAALANAASHAVHRALGFDETERVVFFRKLV